MIIAATVIHKPRVKRCCSVCEEQIGLAPTLQLYGMGMEGDPPYRLYFCLPCATTFPQLGPKIQEVLAAHAAKYGGANGS